MMDLYMQGRKLISVTNESVFTDWIHKSQQYHWSSCV